MNIRTRSSINSFRWVISSLLVLALLFLITAFSAVSYTSGRKFLLGIALVPIGYLLLSISKATLKKIRSLPRVTKIPVYILSGFTILFFTSYLIAEQFQMYIQDGTNFPVSAVSRLILGTEITKYNASIETKDNELTSFDLKENIEFKFKAQDFLDDGAYRLSVAKEILDLLCERKELIQSFQEILPDNIDCSRFTSIEDYYNYSQTDREQSERLTTQLLGVLNKPVSDSFATELKTEEAGFALRKISFQPLTQFGYYFDADQLIAKFRVEGLPKGALYGVKDQDLDAVQVTTFTPSETTVIWSANTIEDQVGISFYYPPYHHFRFLLSSFAGVPSVDQGFLIILGFVTTGVLTEILKPILIDEIKDRVKAIWKKPDQEKAKSSTPMKKKGRKQVVPKGKTINRKRRSSRLK